jgi:hypothetical protein
MHFIILTPGLDEIRDTYFSDVPENIPQDDMFPTVNRAGLLLAEYEGTPQELDNQLLGWSCETLSWYQTLRHSEQHLAAFLQIGTGRVSEIYLFTFSDLASQKAGVAEIKEVCRRQR